MPFFELEPSLINCVVSFIDKINNQNRSVILRHFSDQLLKYEYSLRMSVTQLYSHLQMLCVINFIMKNHEPIDSIAVNSIFYTLSVKSESIRSLKASYVEEELLIAMTIQIIKNGFFHQSKTSK